MEVAETQSSPWWPVLRFVLGIGAAIALGYAAALLLFIGVVVFTGCFWACNQPDPQPFFGIVLLGTSCAAAAGAVTSLAAAFVGRRAPLRTIYVGSFVIATVALTISFANG